MVDQASRLERILRNHDEFVVVGEASETAAVVRRDALLVPRDRAGQLEDALGSRYDGSADDLQHLGLARFRVRGFARGEQISDFVLSSSASARPVHMVLGAPLYSGGPADKPSPITALPRPVPGEPADGSLDRPVRVAVLDTGISRHHPWFTLSDGNLSSDWELIEGLDGWDELDDDNDYDLDAQAGHGTAVAGVVRQQAPSAQLLVGRVLNSDGVSDELRVAQALQALRRHAQRTGRPVDVVNLSLSCYTHDDQPPASVSREIAAFGDDTVFVAAAGNAGSSRPAYPAALPEVLGIGALDGREQASWSNHGSWVDAWADGTRVPTAFVTRGDDTGPLPRLDIDEACLDGFVQWSGTSFAAPVVAGAVAARIEAGQAPAEARKHVLADYVLGDSDGPRP